MSYTNFDADRFTFGAAVASFAIADTLIGGAVAGAGRLSHASKRVAIHGTLGCSLRAFGAGARADGHARGSAASSRRLESLYLRPPRLPKASVTLSTTFSTAWIRELLACWR